ncbi:hypothetical protein BJV78DRAFT_1193427, partial [Lactifluus subvellereus]
MLILLRVPIRPPQYYEKCRRFHRANLFVLERFFCFGSSAAVDALGGGTARFFTITAWRDEGSTMLDDGAWSVGAAKALSRSPGCRDSIRGMDVAMGDANLDFNRDHCDLVSSTGRLGISVSSPSSGGGAGGSGVKLWVASVDWTNTKNAV